MKKKFFFLLLFIFFISINLNKSYAYSSDPVEFVSEIIIEAKKILSSGSTKEMKSQNLSKIAIVTVDVKGLGYYTLGNYRKKLNEDQLKKYLELFEKYFLKSFTSRLTDYSDPKIEVIGSQVINEKYTIVNSKLLGTSDRPEVKMDWRIYTKNPEKPLIRDLIIEGLSLAKTQREEFSSVIENNNGDVSKLFITLEEFISK